MTEEWRPVVGWENLYEVSNHGRMRSLERSVLTCGKLRNFTTRVLPSKMLICTVGNTGYLKVDLKDGKRRKNASVHRLVAQAFIPNTEGKPHVNHIDGPVQHGYRTGLIPYRQLGKGEKSIASKLTEIQVVEIKARIAKGESASVIAKDYPVIDNTIRHIMDGKTWTHI